MIIGWKICILRGMLRCGNNGEIVIISKMKAKMFCILRRNRLVKGFIFEEGEDWKEKDA